MSTKLQILSKTTQKSSEIPINKLNYFIVLQNEFSVNDIENSLVKIFMEKNKLSTQNYLLKKTISKINKNVKNRINEYLNLSDINLTLKNLEEIFEILIDGNDRKLNGAFFTPKTIVDHIIEKTIDKNSTICDCACGSGAFLVEATEKLNKITKKSFIQIIENNIFGVDIIKRNIQRTKILLTLLALYHGDDQKEIKFNLIKSDSLSLNWEKTFPNVFLQGGFDVVISNPPYVRTKNLSDEIKKKIQKKWATATSGNIDLYIPFMELGINLLNKNGILGYIIPNTYFTSLSSKKLRDVLQNNQYLKEIINFNHIQIFKNVTTYACITILDKNPKNKFKYSVINNEKEIKNLTKIKSFDFSFSKLNVEGWRFLDNNDYNNIKKIETIGIPLGEISKISTGIATLRNQVYEMKDPNEIGIYYEKEFENKKYKIEKNITKELVKASIIKDENDLKNNKRRVIFPYKKLNGKMQVIPESELKAKYPKCYEYLLSMKNELQKRDKGKKQYESWYAFGRNQGIDREDKTMLLTPDISNRPKFSICKKKNILFSIGYAIWINDDQTRLDKKFHINYKILKKVLNSKIFEYYIDKTSRHYGSGYRSFNKHYIQKFSIPYFSKEEEKFLMKEDNKIKTDEFLKNIYNIQ